MKQVTQRLKDGKIEVLDVPVPTLQPHGVLVDIRASLLSAGTERTKVETGRQSLIGKARSRPDQVRQVIDKAQRDGLKETIATVRSRLDQPEPLGYSVAGVVAAVGARVRDLAVGDRVACAGAGHASHADVDYVPGNLCTRLPESVDFDQGAFTTVGAIAMQGVRQADVRLCERVAVIGLGLVGQIAGQLLTAAGCEVVGIDLEQELVQVAVDTGAVGAGLTRPEVTEARLATVGECDAVIITAATSSDDPVSLAADLCRDRGRIVVVGDVGMGIERAPYYDKELELRLSRSYGPGRYDTEYEERGLDYPIGYVRWTERRNMAAFVALLERGRVDVGPLVRQEVPVEQAPDAYERLLGSEESSLGILIRYAPSTLEEGGTSGAAAAGLGDAAAPEQRSGSPLRAGLIGAGSFATRVLAPALREAGFSLEAVASASGLSAEGAAKSFDVGRADTPAGVLDDGGIGLAVIATRHSSHAELAEQAMRASKAVFVEKPPCLAVEELIALRDARSEFGTPFFTGFNRRHAPLAGKLREHVRRVGAPLELHYRVATGPIPDDHWLDDPADGGGRLLGEGCHFIDFACWAVESLPVRVSCSVEQSADPVAAAKAFTVTLTFADGSLANILYGHGGAPGVRKEYVEAHSGGRSAILKDFRSLTLVAGRRRRKVRARGQDKGHGAQMVQMREALEGGEASSELDPLQSMAVTLTAMRSAEAGRGLATLRLEALGVSEAGG